MISWRNLGTSADALSSSSSSIRTHSSITLSNYYYYYNRGGERRSKTKSSLKFPFTTTLNYCSLSFQQQQQQQHEIDDIPIPPPPLVLKVVHQQQEDCLEEPEPEQQQQEEADLKQKQKKQKDPFRGVGGSGSGSGSGTSHSNTNGIEVPRQQYIPVSKSDLLNAIIASDTFHSEEDIHHFLLFSSYLDFIIHAEHKPILEQMRLDYNLTTTRPLSHSPLNYKDPDSQLAAAVEEKNSSVGIHPDHPLPSNSSSRIAAATVRFQHAFLQLLCSAQFEELSARDLMLTSALNSDYLLTLPITIDWKKASESNAIIFRRGYTTERQKGLLIVEKLDYLQSKFLQGVFLTIARPLGKIGRWITEAFESASQGQDAQVWTKQIMLWLKEQPLFQQPYSYSEQTSDNLLGIDQLSDSDLPIWFAAQRAVIRYKGILSPVGPRGQLLRKLLIWTGLVPSTPKLPFHLNTNQTTSESYLRPVFLSRISLSDIWEPATMRRSENDLWKLLKASISVLLSKSTLQEPAFQDLILLYTDELDGRETEDKVDFPSMKLKIYERVSIPDLPVVFPHKKLSFRVLDAVRLDVATTLGLLAYFINYKFEDILSSPSAIFLDAISTTALIVYVIRVALGYKQTRDRYQLLVNRTLYEKTLASGFGSVQFLLDASEQQQYKEAILAYAILLKVENGQQDTCIQKVGDRCERFMYSVFKEKVKMPIDKAISTLVRLGLVTETTRVDGKIGLRALPCLEANEVLKQRWNSLLN